MWETSTRDDQRQAVSPTRAPQPPTSTPPPPPPATPPPPPPPPPQKKTTGLWVGLSIGACGFAGIIIFWKPLSDFGSSAYAKYIHHNTALAVPEATNEPPPPPPPELTTEEILQNVGDKYKGLTNYVVKGLSVASVDISGLTPNQPPKAPQNSTEAVSLELGRTNFYRLQWEMRASGTPYKGAAWSAGKGDYVGFGPYPATKTRNRQTALATASGASQAQCIALAELFFDDTNSVARLSAAFAKTNGAGLATKINGRNCYVLDGEFDAHDLVLWIDKDTFLIPQIQFIFGGKLDETKLKNMPAMQRTQLTTWEKLKGTITETYDAPILDTNLTAAAFETDFAPTFSIQMEQSGQSGGGRPRQRAASPTSPTDLTRRVRGGGQAQ